MSITTAKQSFLDKHAFWIILVFATLIRTIPIVSLPFNWLESYFHEISHGIAAVITGGEIVRIQLFPNGAGLCTTQGGSRFFTSFMGYAGAILWGIVIYVFAKFHLRSAQIVSGIILGLLVMTCLLWARDLLTWFILLVLMVVFALKFKYSDNRYFQYLMQFVGLSVILNALYSPFYLLDGRHVGDGATLANITHLPEIMWIGIWVAMALFTIVVLAKWQLKKNNN